MPARFGTPLGAHSESPAVMMPAVFLVPTDAGTEAAREGATSTMPAGRVITAVPAVSERVTRGKPARHWVALRLPADATESSARLPRDELKRLLADVPF